MQLDILRREIFKDILEPDVGDRCIILPTLRSDPMPCNHQRHFPPFRLWLYSSERTLVSVALVKASPSFSDRGVASGGAE